MKSLAITFIILLALFSGCNNSTDINYDEDYSNINSLSVRNAISLANEWKYSRSEITSYITSRELVIEFPDGRTIKKDLSDDEMYIAVAPYINKTHSCQTHYISSCLGELTEKQFNVIVTDENNDVVIDNSIKSMKNGFIELWLPRDKIYTLSVVLDSKSNSIQVGTFESSNTCITTLQLK